MRHPAALLLRIRQRHQRVRRQAGMSSDKLYRMLGTYGVYYGHDGDRLLFRDKNNRSVTVEFSEDMKTVAAVSSAAADPTDTDIGKITGGMTSSEVYAASAHRSAETPREYIPSFSSLPPGIITGSAGQNRGRNRTA